MLRNIKITIEYDGTNYAGWQYQPNKKTIQGEIEKALEKIFKKRIRIIGAGRTDAGVHASGQVANFKIDSNITVGKLHRALNGNLPSDIFVRKVIEVSKDFHARFDALSKIYEYRLLLRRSPLRRRFAWEVKYKIDVRVVKRGLRRFLGEHDFSNFSVARDKENRICKIIKVGLKRKEDEVVVVIEADRFLNKMVRMIIGFLVDLGRGRFDFKITETMFDQRFKKNFTVAPSQGLFLVKVKYSLY
ncbi:MAG: tRNA pseudouridine(38-40) synthase TruA [candidate division WOR-3 bacterium]